jgi:hypothetical protein
MIDYKVQVKLPNGQVSDFISFVVNHPSKGFLKEFDDLELAEAYIQQIDQEFLEDFMVKHFYGQFKYSNVNGYTKDFISWYANLGPFDKVKFIKLLEKVVKINDEYITS